MWRIFRRSWAVSERRPRTHARTAVATQPFEACRRHARLCRVDDSGRNHRVENDARADTNQVEQLTHVAATL